MTATTASRNSQRLLRLPNRRSDAELVDGLRAGEAWARAELFERFAPAMERVLHRVLGEERHTEVADVLHDAFVEALRSLPQLRDAEALPFWMRKIATHTACKTIRRRRAGRWLHFWAPEAMPAATAASADHGVREAYRRTYALLARFPAEEQTAFALRFIEGLELTEVADACGVSLATIKRRLGRAEQRFVAVAQRDAVLASWLERGARWIDKGLPEDQRGDRCNG